MATPFSINSNVPGIESSDNEIIIRQIDRDETNVVVTVCRPDNPSSEIEKDLKKEFNRELKEEIIQLSGDINETTGQRIQEGENIVEDTLKQTNACLKKLSDVYAGDPNALANIKTICTTFRDKLRKSKDKLGELQKVLRDDLNKTLADEEALREQYELKITAIRKSSTFTLVYQFEAQNPQHPPRLKMKCLQDVYKNLREQLKLYLLTFDSGLRFVFETTPEEKRNVQKRITYIMGQLESAFEEQSVKCTKQTDSIGKKRHLNVDTETAHPRKIAARKSQSRQPSAAEEVLKSTREAADSKPPASEPAVLFKHKHKCKYCRYSCGHLHSMDECLVRRLHKPDNSGASHNEVSLTDIQVDIGTEEDEGSVGSSASPLTTDRRLYKVGTIWGSCNLKCTFCGWACNHSHSCRGTEDWVVPKKNIRCEHFRYNQFVFMF